MIGHLRIKSPWSQLGLVLGTVGAGLIITSIILSFVLLSRGIPMGDVKSLDWSQPHVLQTMKLVQAISSVTIFMVPALLFALVTFTDRQLFFIGIRPPVKTLMYVLAILCAVVSFPFTELLGNLNRGIPLPQWMTGMEQDLNRQMAQFLKAGSAFDVMLNVFIIAFLPALCEELFFRGVLQRVMINISKNAWTGIIITAVLFSAAHMQFQGFLPRMFLGVVLGALYWYSGSLWTSILAHFVINGVQVVVVSYIPEYLDKNPSMPLWLCLVSAIAVTGILSVYRSFSTVTYEKVYEPNELNRSNEFIA